MDRISIHNSDATIEVVVVATIDASTTVVIGGTSKSRRSPSMMRTLTFTSTITANGQNLKMRRLPPKLKYRSWRQKNRSQSRKSTSLRCVALMNKLISTKTKYRRSTTNDEAWSRVTMQPAHRKVASHSQPYWTRNVLWSNNCVSTETSSHRCRRRLTPLPQRRLRLTNIREKTSEQLRRLRPRCKKSIRRSTQWLSRLRRSASWSKRSNSLRRVCPMLSGMMFSNRKKMSWYRRNVGLERFVLTYVHRWTNIMKHLIP